MIEHGFGIIFTKELIKRKRCFCFDFCVWQDYYMNKFEIIFGISYNYYLISFSMRFT